MICDCVRCGESGELVKVRNARNNQTEHVRMRNRVINSYLKSCPPLCPDCLASLLDWVESAVHAEMFKRKWLRNDRPVASSGP
jgi:hypothetical protein